MLVVWRRVLPFERQQRLKQARCAIHVLDTRLTPAVADLIVQFLGNGNMLVNLPRLLAVLPTSKILCSNCLARMQNFAGSPFSS